MIDAGLPLVQCLEILATRSRTRSSRPRSGHQVDRRAGRHLQRRAPQHPKIFDELFVNLVQAGEVGGILDTILNRLAVYIEKRVKLGAPGARRADLPDRRHLHHDGVMVVLMTFVIPAFEGMFAEFGAKDALPALTKIVIALSKGFVTYCRFIIVGHRPSSAGRSPLLPQPSGGEARLHEVMLKLPIIGPVLQKIAVARFTRTLGTLLASGVPILDALDIVAKTAGNVIIEEGLIYARARISEGKNMAEPLGEINVFPGMVVQMVAVGEQTGALDTMLNKIADFYEEEVDVAVAALTSLLEPLMMVVVGAVVGVVLAAMYLPLYSVLSKIG